MSKSKNNFTEEIKALEARKIELAAESQLVLDAIERRAQEIAKAFFDKRDPQKLIDAQASDREKLQAIRDALTLCDLELGRCREAMNAEFLAVFLSARSEFNQDIVRFIDADLKPLLEKFSKIQASWNSLVNEKMGRAGVGYTTPNFPFIELHLFNALSFYLAPNSLPGDLEQLERAYKDHFSMVRKAR